MRRRSGRSSMVAIRLQTRMTARMGGRWVRHLDRSRRLLFDPVAAQVFLPPDVCVAAESIVARLGSEARRKLDLERAAVQLTWHPSEPMIIEDRLVSEGGWIERNGCELLQPLSPAVAAIPGRGNAGRWVDHVRLIYPDDAEHIIRWLAHRVQRSRAERSITHWCWAACQGIGKDTLFEPVKRAVGPGMSPSLAATDARPVQRLREVGDPADQRSPRPRRHRPLRVLRH